MSHDAWEAELRRREHVNTSVAIHNALHAVLGNHLTEGWLERSDIAAMAHIAIDAWEEGRPPPPHPGTRSRGSGVEEISDSRREECEEYLALGPEADE